MLKVMIEHDGQRQRVVLRLCLLAVTVLLAGLAVTAGVQCSGGMTMPLVPASLMSHGPTAIAVPDMDSSAMPAVSHDVGAPLTTGAAGSVIDVVSAVDGSMPMTPDMLMGTCMALLAIALLAVTIRRSRTGVLLPLVAAVRLAIAPLFSGAPSLTRLCVLRT